MSRLSSALSHVSLGTNQFELATEFYDAVLAPLGIRRILDLSEHQAIAYGREFPEFWIQRPYNGQKAETANGVHIAFLAENNSQVDAFYQAALAQGATADGTPR
ncbi:VOC family protein [Uruburuella testudinis]|uniref:VOC family protein n=1 Tax=Uruburuella testudinis TaxID=1282863 RepID=A0ABY4DPQ4_9NEIS|nr:VOC family protein [Uruburuella testudinis]UOO80714.1 VOC family protein [Uruburuella testudinis]